jgi:sulfite oxidase
MPLDRRAFLAAAGGAILSGTSGCASWSDLSPSPDDLSDLLLRPEDPGGAEPALGDLDRSWITPVRSFFIRRHGSLPVVDLRNWRLVIDGRVEHPQSLTLYELTRGFPSAGTVATLQCAENRSGEHARIRPVLAPVRGAGAVGNARWDGVALSELLRRAGPLPDARHVHFESVDECPRRGGSVPFGASIPLAKATAPETLVATEMNGAPLTREHGFPARVVVPGFIGARSVKWLGRIRVSDRPSENPFQTRAYRILAAEADVDEPASWEEAEPLEGGILNSAVTRPLPGAALPARGFRVTGYAVAGEARGVARVEVSADGGWTWQDARMGEQKGDFRWRLWEAELKAAPGPALVCVRATDTAGIRQPDASPWNPGGYHFNAWHRVPVTLA